MTTEDTRKIIDLHVLQNKQDLLSKTKSVKDMAIDLGVDSNEIYYSIERLRRRKLYPLPTERRNRGRRQVELPIVDLTPLEMQKPTGIDPSVAKAKKESLESELLEMKATIMAQEQIIKYLEKQLGMRHGTSV